MTDDIALDEKRVYGDRRDRTVAYAAPEHAADGCGGWRSRALGVRGVVGLAVS